MHTVPYAPYQGFIFRKEGSFDEKQKNQNAALAIINYIRGRGFKELRFSNIYFANDFRFLEKCSGMKENKILVRYTAVKDLEHADDISRLRKREIRKAESLGMTTEESGPGRIDVFLELYERTFARQGILLSCNEMDIVKNLSLHVIQNGYGRLWNQKTCDGKVTNARLVLLGASGFAYDLFAGNDPDYRNTGGSAALLAAVWKYLKGSGFCCFDFLGANSPARGDWKLSFNSRLCPYYLCDIKF